MADRLRRGGHRAVPGKRTGFPHGRAHRVLDDGATAAEAVFPETACGMVMDIRRRGRPRGGSGPHCRGRRPIQRIKELQVADPASCQGLGPFQDDPIQAGEIPPQERCGHSVQKRLELLRHHVGTLRYPGPLPLPASGSAYPVGHPAQSRGHANRLAHKAVTAHDSLWLIEKTPLPRAAAATVPPESTI
ncbi:hypothetical protein RC1_3876 [Rhodospirillum centenum SW]|uniref:Uncharacterized protein n=1 Tax=Rhodospirillum centenum (strain ATCC 51521 / SW) TaxID=414684 RepID=B6IY45_RHOCS|nr:hypothetical protein RC1_3876 [Rhodospirillum centenum SW]